MAFLGYLVKINGVIFPNRLIALKTFSITPNQTMDEDSYTDGDGLLHRNILPHKRTKAEFDTPLIKEADSIIITNIIPNTTSMTAEIWNPKKHIYETGTYYTPDITYTISEISDTDLVYEPIRIAFIEY